MNSTDKSVLSLSEIKDIIQFSASTGVTVLKYRDLYVRFGTSTDKKPQTQEIETNSDTKISETDQEEVLRNSVEREEMNLREEQLAHAIVENPRLYEELLLDEELEDADDEPGPEQ